MKAQFLALAALASLAGCATLSAPTVPASLAAPAGEKVVGKADGKGVQIYRCTENAGQLRWAYQGPETTLMQGSKEVGKIARGPAFEWSDGSKANARVRAQEPAPGFAVPWTVYNVESTSGSGMLTRVSTIQMVNTMGGRAPEGNCSQNQKDINIRVNYSATYFFYSK